jgi:hypothetical protein
MEISREVVFQSMAVSNRGVSLHSGLFVKLEGCFDFLWLV